MPTLIGEPLLLRPLNALIKTHYHSPRAFVLVTITPDGQCNIHSNMDIPSQRVELLLAAATKLRSMA